MSNVENTLNEDHPREDQGREAIEEVLEADIQASREVLEVERNQRPHTRRLPGSFESRVYRPDLTKV